MSIKHTRVSFFPAYAKDIAEEIQKGIEPITIPLRDISSDDKTEALETAFDPLS
jgi:hypothetical protein